MFDLMMRAFANQVRGIRGSWRTGFQGRPSVNVDKVNELTGKGVPLDEAIGQTWTVTRAKRWGFARTTLLPGTEGTPGAFVKIDVLIEK